MQDTRSFPCEGFYCQECGVVKTLMSLAKYYYTATHLFTQKAHHKLIIFQILISHINTVIIIKLCQTKQH